MAKGFGKFVLFSLFAGAAAAGTLYYLNNKKEEDLFEDSEPDVNDDLEEFLKNESGSGPSASEREYVPLNFSREAVLDAEKDTAEEKPEEKAEPEKQEEAVPEEPAAKEPERAPEETVIPEEPAAKEPESAPKETVIPEETEIKIEKPLEDTAEKVVKEEENIIGNPVEEVKASVEKAADADHGRISTFSFSSFE